MVACPLAALSAEQEVLTHSHATPHCHSVAVDWRGAVAATLSCLQAHALASAWMARSAAQIHCMLRVSLLWLL